MSADHFAKRVNGEEEAIDEELLMAGTCCYVLNFHMLSCISVISIDTMHALFIVGNFGL